MDHSFVSLECDQISSRLFAICSSFSHSTTIIEEPYDLYFECLFALTIIVWLFQRTEADSSTFDSIDTLFPRKVLALPVRRNDLGTH